MGSEARTRLGLAALLFPTLLGFSRVFEEGDYPGPAMLGALLAVGIAMLTRRIGLSTWASLVVSAASLVWYLALIFESPNNFYGFPTPASLQHLVGSVRQAYEHSSVDFAPVPLRPGYVIGTIAALWMLATIGEVATFRWRRPLVPGVAATALFSFLLILGVRKGAPFLAIFFLMGLLTYLGLEAAHRLQAWGRWVSAWSTKRWDTESTTGPLARRMGASCLAAALVAPLFLPSIGGGLLRWRNNSGPGGFSGRIDPLVSLAPKLIEQSDQVLFRVRSSEPVYWRLITLTYFDGETWHPETTREAAPNDAITSDVPRPQPARSVDQAFSIKGLKGDLLPAASLPSVVSFTGDSSSEYDDALEFNPSTGDLELTQELAKGTTYEVQSLVPDVGFKSMHDATVPAVDSFDQVLPSYIPREVYEVPQNFCPGFGGEGRIECGRLNESPIYRIAKRWTKRADSPFEKLLALQNRFRGRFVHQLPGPGDVEVRPKASAEYLTRFLTSQRVGYCQQFATAFAVLARMLGYPTRVGVGFLPGETTMEAPNSYTVRGNDAHAWPEVYFDDLGWVAFEPTPRGAAPPPAYTAERPTPPGVNTPPQVGGPVRGQAGGAAALPRGLRDSLDVRRTRLKRPRPPDTSEWRAAFLRLTLALLVVALVVMVAIPALKAWWTRREYRRAIDADARAGAAFAHFEREARDLASPRAEAETASTYVRRLIRMRAVPGGPASRLARLFETAAYGPLSLSDEEGEEAIRLVKSLRRELWAEAGWWQRMARLFSSAALTDELVANGAWSGLRLRLSLASRS